MKNTFLYFFSFCLIFLLTSCKESSISNSGDIHIDEVEKVLSQLREELLTEKSKSLINDSLNLDSTNILMAKATHLLAKFVYSRKNIRPFTDPIPADSSKSCIKMMITNHAIWDTSVQRSRSLINNYEKTIIHHDLTNILPLFEKSSQPGINIYPIKIKKETLIEGSCILELTDALRVLNNNDLYDYGTAGGKYLNSKVHPKTFNYRNK